MLLLFHGVNYKETIKMELEKRIEEAMLGNGSTWISLDQLESSHVNLSGMDEMIKKGKIYYFHNKSANKDMFTLPAYANEEIKTGWFSACF